MKSSSTDVERLATVGSYAFQKSQYQKLCSYVTTLPQHNCYTFTLSPSSNYYRSMLSSVTLLTTYIGKFLDKQEIKSCFYTIEQSKHGKLHAHGIIHAKSTFKYKGLASNYPGVQIYIAKYKPQSSRDVLYHEESIPPTTTSYKPEQWIKYISKEPLAYVTFLNGKNFIKYTVCRGS